MAARSGRNWIEGVVGARVDRDDVGAVGEVTGPEFGEMSALLVEHADGAALGGDVKAVGALVVGEDIGSCADPDGADDLPVREVDGEQGGVVVAGDERESAPAGRGRVRGRGGIRATGAGG
ncbi:hypothetical protein HYG77_39060 (plasmid) [Rhodococcus sp. ZPP]|nr:hypothetical protein HYG77_39060 [Rhodococcus sp. ZPP]